MKTLGKTVAFAEYSNMSLLPTLMMYMDLEIHSSALAFPSTSVMLARTVANCWICFPRGTTSFCHSFQ